MKVLVACEYSGRVRDAFIAAGHEAMSCDLLETEVPGPHYVGDVFDIIGGGWDLMVCHPPCTHLSVSGSRWAVDHWVQSKQHPEGRYWHDGSAKRAEQAGAIEFVKRLMAADIPRIALENPISIISSQVRKPDQTIQPWQFGHGETKATCLWLKNLPKLKPTMIVEGREAKCHRMAPSPTRWKERSRTYAGIAKAMAEQWGAE